MSITSRTSLSGFDEAAFRVPGWPYDRPAYESLAAAVQGEASRWNVPGIAVGVLINGTTEVTSTGFGNLATRQPLTDDSILQIGSISKVFTTTLAMMLVDDGKLDLDEPVLTWVPDLPLADETARTTITMRHLLSHTAGFEGDRFIDYGRGDDSLARAIAEFGTLRQWTAPGDLWAYCNAGFYLASRVIEVIAAKPFEDIFRERLIDPLGLDSTFFFAEDVITRPHAVGHYLVSREAGLVPAHGYSFPRYVNGTGGVVTSTRQLLRFAELHLGNGKLDGKRLLSAKSAKLMQKPVAEAGDFHRSYGLGWCVHDYPGLRTISHGGATRGFRANLTVIPDKAFAIATLTNGDTGSRAIQEIEAWALDHYVAFERPEPQPVELAADALASVSGIYERHDGHFSASIIDNRLDLKVVSFDEESGEVEDETTFPLIAVGERRYRVPDGPGKGSVVDFIAYGDGQQFLRMGGRLAERTSDLPQPNAEKPAKKSGSKASKPRKGSGKKK